MLSYMKDAFEQWIKSTVNNNGKTYSEETVSGYIASLKNHASKLTDIHLDNTDLFSIVNINDFSKAYSIIKQSADYNEINKLYHRIFSSALSAYERFLSEASVKDVANALDEDFEKWMRSYPNHKYTDNTIKRYIHALQKTEEWLGITLPCQVLSVNTLGEFQIIEQQIRSSENFAAINQDHGHGDLSAALAAYKKYLENFSIRDLPRLTGTFDSWEIVGENTAIKTCDKSFFEHNGSGVPKEICWFFEVEDLPQGETRQITLTYNGKDYTGRISNDTTDRIRIFWNTDLGNTFKALRKSTTQRLKFTKTEKRYLIRFEGDEQEVSTKQAIESIKEYIAAAGFTYPDGMIENFWLSLKSKPFVILAGTSGTGKTRLVRLFANAISAEYKLVAVRPDWSDSSDLFGHIDLNGNFVPGEVLDFMNRAKANPQKPYILCLDEMNLARVEYYLSDVLSIMETRELRNGIIESDPILDESYYGKKDSAARERYGIQRIPENFYIVGTVNMDETTFPFSRKVLDRANTIEFSYVDLVMDFDAIPAASVQQQFSNDFLKTDYLFISQCASEKEYVGKVCDELQRINGILQEGNAHVGYRVRDEIVFYMLNNKKAGLLDEKKAFDNEIMQKILPRIQGSSASVKKLLCSLFAELEGSYSDTNGSDSENMKNYINEKADKLQHPQSARKICFMTRRFEEDGFTSYWL